MSIRELLKARPEDVKVKREHDVLTCVYSDGKRKYVPSPVIRSGKVFRKAGNEEIPLINSDLVPEELKDKIQKNKSFRDKYLKENPDAVLSLGDNPGGKKLVWKSEEEADKRLQDLQEQYDNLHIVVCRSHGNLMNGKHHTLSCRVPATVWEKIKHCFRYFDSSKFNDEVWGDVFKGYEILSGKIQEVEDILEIPEHLRFEQLQEEKKKQESREKKEKEERKKFIAEIEKEFSHENSMPDGIPEGKQIVLDGEEVPFRNMDSRIYGGGEWFVIQDSHIWWVRNNGMDGDDWSYNNIRTGGAGAIGFRFKKTEDRMQLIEKLKILK